MKQFALSLLVFTIVCCSLSNADISASELVLDIYKDCLSEISPSCVKTKSLAWMSRAASQDIIKITKDMSIIRTSEDEQYDFSQERNTDDKVNFFDKIDNFLSTHSLKINPPEFLSSGEARSLLPKSFLTGGLASSLQIPLVNGNNVEGRGFIRKVMIPFLLGLKFKTTVLVPLTLALIALKTWKAMTLALLSLVLSGALVIFKLAKPKVVNYEVVHYPPVEHHLDHHLDHHIDHHHVEHVEHIPPPQGWEPQAWSRDLGAQKLAYNGQI